MLQCWQNGNPVAGYINGGLHLRACFSEFFSSIQQKQGNKGQADRLN